MMTIQAELFSFDELSEEAQKVALRHEIELVESDPHLVDHVQEEVMDSLRTIIEAVGYRMTDWSIGPYSPCYVETNCGHDPYSEGNAAVAKFVRTIVSRGYDRFPKFEQYEGHKFDGICGFTGVCYDDTLVEEILDSLIQGEDFRTAFSNAASVIGKILEDEIDYLTSEESVLEMLDRDSEDWLEDGRRAPHYYRQSRK